jgi:hypothetical protein
MGKVATGFKKLLPALRKADTGPNWWGMIPGQARNVSLQLNSPKKRSFRLAEEITHLTIPHWGFPLKFQLLAPFGTVSAFTTGQRHSS